MVCVVGTIEDCIQGVQNVVGVLKKDRGHLLLLIGGEGEVKGRGGGGYEKNGMPNFIFSPPFFFSLRSYIGRTRRIRFFKHKLKELFAVNSCRILLTGNVILYRFFKIRKRVLALP